MRAMVSVGGGAFRVVSFFTTDPHYWACAQRLVETLRAVGVDYCVVPVVSSGRWEENCSRKADFVRQQWRDSPVPVVWIDADATLEAYPVLFDTLEGDFAAHKFNGWQLASGTLYFAKTQAAEALLDRWVLRCQADPMGWDQDHLHSAWCDVTSAQADPDRPPLRTVWLPRPYLQIFDAPQTEPPVVKHWQASRAVAKGGLKPKAQPLQITPQGQQDRRLDRLWRSAEELWWMTAAPQGLAPQALQALGPSLVQALAPVLNSLSGQAQPLPIIDMGCGDGSLAALFDPALYLGMDPNPVAIALARQSWPEHQFRTFDEGYAVPAASAVLFHDVLWCLDGPKVVSALQRAAAATRWIVIAEPMDSQWRNSATATQPATFGRDPEQIILALQNFGFCLCTASKYPTPESRPTSPFDPRTSVLTFERP